MKLSAPGVNTASDTPLSPRVMLLSLWARPGEAWHARLVGDDALVHEFQSPFELVRFLAQAPPPPARDAAAGGLR